MKTLDMFFLILTLASVLGLRIWQCPPWRDTSAWWDETEKYRLQNMGLLLGLTIFMGFVPLPWWMGLILLVPILAVCAWSISAAYDWDDTTSIGDLYNKRTWGSNRAGLNLRLKIRLYAIGGVFALLALTWIVVAILSAFDNGSAPSAQPPVASPTTQAPATTAPTTAAVPTTQPTVTPTDSTSATPSTTAPSEHAKCMDDIPVDKAVNESYKTSLGNVLIVCRGGDWTTVNTKAHEQVQVLKWVQDGTYEYDLIPLGGRQVWVRVPYVK